MANPVVVVGATGRMGLAVMTQVLQSDFFELIGAVVGPNSSALGCGVASRVTGAPIELEFTELSASLVKEGTVLIDFSTPDSLRQCVDIAQKRGAALVTGTTGADSSVLQALKGASEHIPVVAASNMSVGIAVLREAVRSVTAQLGPAWDAEVLELHHRRKKDSPSGTALTLAQTVAEAREGASLESLQTYRGRGETGPRTDNEIGMSAIRGGGIVGEHTVYFISEDERLELSHRALDRSLFARGSLVAARFALGASPGLYDMPDVLGFGRGR